MPDLTAQSPLGIAMRRFLGRGSARIGLAVLALFMLAATYAPLLCSNVALIWWDDSGLSFPVLQDVFNRNQYGKPHHLLFNCFAMALPVMIVLSVILRRVGWSWLRCLLVACGLQAACMLIVMAPIIPGDNGWQPIWRQRPLTQQTVQHYHERSTAGEEITACFALVPHGFRDKYEAYVGPLSVNEKTGARFWLGTDDRGADVLARMIYGARVSLTIGLVAVGISMLIGIVIGAVSGFSGGWVDLLLQRVVELMMTFPTFILVLIAVATFGRDIYVIMVIFGLTGWAGIARLVRGEFLSHSEREYVLAAKALGLSRSRIMFRHILPNVMAPLLISATFGLAGTVLTESGLAFIGLGDDSVPSWGSLLDVGRQQVQYAWLVWVPGLAIFWLVTSLNLIGNTLREALDPKAQPR